MREAPVASTLATVPPKQNRALTDCRDEALTLLKAYRRTPAEGRTPLLRSLAGVLVAAREHFSRDDGTPDWKGRTYAYRTWVREVYGDAGFPTDELPTVQAAVRYHIGAALRERLDDDTLREYGLIERSPRERSQDRRAEKSALLSAFSAREHNGGALLALSAAYHLIERLQVEDLDSLGDREAGVAEETLADLERRVRQFRRRLAR